MKRLLVVTAIVAAGVFAARMHERTLIADTESAGAVELPVRVDSIASPAGAGSAEPNLTVSPEGRVFLSWLEPADSAFSLRVAAMTGSGWTAPQTVRTGRDFFVNWADFPSVIALGGDRLAVHWLQRTGSATYAYGVRVAVSANAGRTWAAPVIPHRDTSNTEHGFVSLWPEGSAGDVSAVWLDGRKYDKSTGKATNEMMLVSTTLRGPAGTRGTEGVLDSRVCDCCQTSVAVTAKGPVVVYRDRTADEIRDISVVRRIGTGASARWTEPALVHRDGWKINACPVNGPAIDADGNDVAVAWFTGADGRARVHLAYSRDAGETFSAPVRVDEGQPAGRVDVELLRDGGALVTWVERTGGDTAAVRARRVFRDGRLGSSVTIAQSSAARASGFPRMALTGSGNAEYAVFAWTVPGRPSHVRVARARVSEFR